MNGNCRAAFCLLLGIGLLIATPAARAATNFGMQLTSSPITLTICDNNSDFVGCTGDFPDEDPTLGSILVNANVAAWSLTATHGMGPPVLTLPNLLSLSTASASSSAGAMPITFLLTLVGVGTGSPNITLLTNTAGTSGLSTTTVTVQTWLSTQNITFCASTACGGVLVTTVTYSGLSWGSVVSGSANAGAGPFAITLLVTINTQGLADTITFAPTVNQLLPCAVCGHRSALPAADGRQAAANAMEYGDWALGDPARMWRNLRDSD